VAAVKPDDCLLRQRIAGFKEFRAGAYPEERRLAPIADAEFAAFIKVLPEEPPRHSRPSAGAGARAAAS